MTLSSVFWIPLHSAPWGVTSWELESKRKTADRVLSILASVMECSCNNCSFGHSPDSHTSQVRSKPEASSRFPMEVIQPKHLDHLRLLLPLAGSSIAPGAAGTQTGAYMGCWPIRKRLDLLYHGASPTRYSSLWLICLKRKREAWKYGVSKNKLWKGKTRKFVAE